MVGAGGLAGGDIAEGAGAGADGAEDHHGRMLLLPAFAEVRAGGFLTDRVQLQVAHQLARLGHFRRGRGLGADPVRLAQHRGIRAMRSEEHTSELPSLMRISYAVFCLKKKKNKPIRIEKSQLKNK